MKQLVRLMLAVGVAGACTQTPPETKVVNDAAEALGGASQVQAVKTLTLEGAGMNANLGQNRNPDADLPLFDVTAFTRTVDLTNGRARQDQTRVAAGQAGAQPQKQNFGLDGDVAFNVGADGKAVRQAARVATDRRNELILHHPVAVIQAALDPAATVANARKVGNMDVVDVTTAKGERLTLATDAATHLPVTVTSMSYNVNLGDVAVETAFLDYQNVDGLMLPARLTSKIDKYPNADLKIAKSTVNGTVGDLAASADVQSAPVPVATANVTVEPVGRNIWFLAGQSHNSVLVEFADHTELIEVPQNDTRALAVIAKARELKPDKPLTKVIVTHHHFDHSGGIRAAISEGLTLVTHEMNKPFFEYLAQRNHTIVQDALVKNPKPPQIETVADSAVEKDAVETMEIYHVEDGTAHSDSMLMVYFPKERALVQADFYNTQGTVFPRAANLNENIQKRKIRVDRHLPIHGPMKTAAEFAKALQPPAPNTN